jgi:hypothetical protein
MVGVFGHDGGLSRPTSDTVHADFPDPADAGFGGEFKPADQHTHLVQEILDLGGYTMELNDWYVSQHASVSSLCRI